MEILRCFIGSVRPKTGSPGGFRTCRPLAWVVGKGVGQIVDPPVVEPVDQGGL